MTRWTGLSVIVPAWNEAARIGAVLSVAAGHTAVDEVLVVDDGSTDGTAEVAARIPGVTVIRQPQNGGKTRALLSGIAAARFSHLMFLDADLIGLTPADLNDLARPVQEARAAVSISLRGNAPRLWQRIGLDYISGERVMARQHLPADLDELTRLPGFGIEVALNRHWIEQGLSLAVVPWPGVSSPLKAAKQGLAEGLKSDARMMRDIFRTVSPAEALHQIAAMRRMRVAA